MAMNKRWLKILDSGNFSSCFEGILAFGAFDFKKKA